MTAHAHRHDPELSSVLPTLVALDSLIHGPLLDEATAFARALAPDVADIVDIGAGTGAGVFALAARYPDAAIVAVDVRADMLAAVRDGAAERRIEARVRTVLADVGDPGLDLGPADLVWSSNAMHEVPDPPAAFRALFHTLRPGGLLLIMEMDGTPRVLPEEFASLETALRSGGGAHAGGHDWAGAIVSAGFDLIDTRTLAIDRDLPAQGPGGVYAALELRRLARHARLALAHDEIDALQRVIDDLGGPHHLLDRVRVRGTRTLWAARRP